MFTLAWRNLLRRPLRNGLALAGVTVSLAVLMSIVAFGAGYRSALKAELDRAGVQIMVVPLGCPYDAAARVLKNQTLEASLPENALDSVRSDPAVAIAAPLLMAALPRTGERRTDLWVGLDATALQLKPWWAAVQGGRWFSNPDDVILGADAAALEMRQAGDRLHSPETGRSFRVAGVLSRSGTSDDSAFFIPLTSAQAMFGQERRLTAIAIRLKDPTLINEARSRLQEIRGAQVVTITEMMGTLVNLVGAVRTLVLAVASVAVAVSVLAVFNTLLAAIVERTTELAVMRAVGASRAQVFTLLILESLIVTGTAAGLAVLLSASAGPVIESLVKSWFPLAPAQSFLVLTPVNAAQCAAIGMAAGLIAAVYPAWRASLLPPANAIKSE